MLVIRCLFKHIKIRETTLIKYGMKYLMLAMLNLQWDIYV